MDKKILTEEEARQLLPNNIQFIKEDGLYERLIESGYVTFSELIKRIDNADNSTSKT